MKKQTVALIALFAGWILTADIANATTYEDIAGQWCGDVTDYVFTPDTSVAVCVLPGTELSFANEVMCLATGLLGRLCRVINHKKAIFRQINKQKIAAHHDALEFPDGQIVLLTVLCEGQQATVLQLPAEPKTAFEAEAQQRAAYVR